MHRLNHWVSLWTAVVLLAGAAAPALAQDVYAPIPASSWESALSEIRVGINAHAVAPNFLPVANPATYDLSHIDDISFDVLFNTPYPDVFRWIGSPRPNIGGTISLEGRESTLHAALTWHAQLFSTPFYLEGTLGAAANNGYLTDAPPTYHNMGCRVQFYEVFGAGVDITKNLTATLAWEHTSNADLCSQNDGLTDLGVRIGYKF